MSGLDGFFSALQVGGVPFVALDRGPAYLDTTGWAEREGKWHLFREGRSICRGKHAITSFRQRVFPAPPEGAKVCACCKKRSAS
ncbi:hypothetical protein [Deinococcus sp. S9]|uniref:hypothetical protein n=1 Tax=Deinococcus sp. S9 TaxID=2545754 RepID=UPI001056AAFA|nr:hypothetical protein [Deinococcus sp. S9]TDE87392.1 hypothetical protein E0686_02550 [Deinococcus sp. S9]